MILSRLLAGRKEAAHGESESSESKAFEEQEEGEEEEEENPLVRPPPPPTPPPQAVEAPAQEPGEDETSSSAWSERAAEELRSECERGLKRARYMMAYMVCVTAAIAPTVAVNDWVVIQARRGNLQKDWWKCLVEQNVVLHWIDSSQRYKLPGVLSALLYQSCLLAWASIIIYQRSCIRMDWISSCIVNNAYTLLLILLPPLSTQWDEPSAISASLITLVDYLWAPDVFEQVRGPNKCGRAHAFCRVCLCLTACCAAVNLLCLVLVIRAESIRRRAIAAEKRYVSEITRMRRGSSNVTYDEDKVGRDSLLGQGLAHRLCCTDGAPREIVFGCGVLVTYLASAAARAATLIVGQRSFDHFTRERTISVTSPFTDDVVYSTSVVGGTALVALAPAFAIGPSLAVLSFASILRGFSGDDLANYRIAAFLALGALVVDVPSLSALMHGVIQNRLWNFDLGHCVHDYVRDRANDIYGFPDVPRAKIICKCFYLDFYAVCLHVLFVFLMAGSSIRTFTFNDRSIDNVVTPAPNTTNSMHLLHTDDATSFEYDLAPPFRRQEAASLFHRAETAAPRSQTPQRSGSDRYSAIFIRPRLPDPLPRPPAPGAARNRGDSMPELLRRGNSTPRVSISQPGIRNRETSVSANNSPRFYATGQPPLPTLPPP